MDDEMSKVKGSDHEGMVAGLQDVGSTHAFRDGSHSAMDGGADRSCDSGGVDETRVAEIAKRVAEASGAPWVVDFPQHSENGLVSTYDGDYALADVFGLSADAEFIAAAREDIPWLLAGLDSARMDARQARVERRDAEEHRDGLLDRLRAAEAELAAEKDARDEVQEKIAYLRRNCMGLPEQELRQKIGAVDSAEWKRGYYWNALVAERRDKQVAAEVAQRAAEARAAEAEAVIAEAPHAADCHIGPKFMSYPGHCNCWKLTAPSAALVRIKAEAAAQALEEASWSDTQSTHNPAQVRDMMRARAAEIREAK